MEVFITAGKQLFIVLLILVSLPLACKLLWWLRLLPLAVYFVATKLFFPAWAADYQTLFPCMGGRPQNPVSEPLCRMYSVCDPGMGAPYLPQETGTAVLGNADII